MYRLCVYKMLNINIDIFISNIYKIYHVCVFLHVYVCTYIIFKNIRFQKWLLNYVPFTCKYLYIQESKWNLKDWKDYNWQDYKDYTIRQDGGGSFDVISDRCQLKCTQSIYMQQMSSHYASISDLKE